MSDMTEQKQGAPGIGAGVLPAAPVEISTGAADKQAMHTSMSDPLPPADPPAPVPPSPPPPAGPEPAPAPIQDPTGPDGPVPGEPGAPPAGDPPEAPPVRMKEIGGPKGPEPTRYGDWERKGRVSDF